jgi:hypothetical protein
MPSLFAITDSGSGRAGLRAARLSLFVHLPHPVLRFLAATLEPVEHLCRRVDLVVMLALGKNRQLVQVFGEPRRLLRQMHEAILGHRGLGVHAHDLVRLRLVAGHGVQALLDQFLGQLGPRHIVLDQHDTGFEGRALLAHCALQLGIFHPLAQYVQQVEVFALDAPAGADAEIAELGGLVGSVPALHDAIELLGPLVRCITAEPPALTMPPPCGAGICWYWPAKLYSPIVRRIWSRLASGCRSGCNASPRCRVKDSGPSAVSSIHASSSSAIAGKRTISQSSCAITWPARSSSCSRCMIRMIAPIRVSFSRL